MLPFGFDYFACAAMVMMSSFFGDLSIYLSIYPSQFVFKNALSLIGFIAGGVGQLMLDISMRPGSAETFPLLASFGIVVYILEVIFLSFNSNPANHICRNAPWMSFCSHFGWHER